MKTLFSIVFLSALLSQPFYQCGYIVYWQFNKDRIAKTECINRFKPMLHCNGKCQLYAKLKKAADEEAANNKLPIMVLKLKNVDTFIETPLLYTRIGFFSNISEPHFYSADESIRYGYSDTPLKPPQGNT